MTAGPTATLQQTPASTPTALPEGASLEPTVELVASGGAAFAMDLPDHGVLWHDGAEVFKRGALQAQVSLGEVGAVYSGALVQGALLLSTDQGLLAEVEGQLLSSPLNAWVGAGPAQLLVTPGASGDDLWIATAAALYRWRAGAVATVSPAGLSAAAARLSWGQRDGQPALWVASQGQLYALVETQGGLGAWPQRVDFAAADVAATPGSTWALAGDGALWWRPDGEAWQDTGLGGVGTLKAEPDDEALWLQLEAGQWLRWSPAQGLQPIEGAAPRSLLAVGPDQGALATSAQGLQRLVLGRQLFFVGASPNMQVDQPVRIGLVPTWPEGAVE